MNIQIDLLAMERLNLALLQNRVPLIQRVEVVNNSPEQLENLRLKIKSDPEGALEGEVTISLIMPGESYVLENPRISHSWDFFKQVNEKICGRLMVELMDETDSILAQANKDIEIEPETVWLGQQAPLELLVSHISPNSAAVQQINRKASEILKSLSGNSALNGYQSKDKQRVYQIAQAIYQAIRDAHITYSEPPASFEASGQKIRTSDQILNSNLATCLDITLLYSACLEQAGIFSLVFIIEGHSFSGFWLEDKFLPRPLEEDPQFFRKRIELDEMVAVEITGATLDNDPGFSNLEVRGREHLENEAQFVCGIDVNHCRRHARIFPLNDHTAASQAEMEKRENRGEAVSLENRSFKNFEIPENAEGRQEELDKWKDKLLDLSFRNRLLNFRPNKGTVEILCHSPNEIEDILADGTAFEISPQPKQSSLNFSRTDQKEILADQISASFERKKLLTRIPEEKFQSVLNSLYRSVVNAEEETGANTLYLALGILSWKETDRSTVERRSPLLLLPVNLKKKSVGGRFSLTLRDDDTVLNHTLLQKLKRDYDLNFPGLDPLPEDESGVNVSLIFDMIRRIIRDKRGWEVKEEVWLSEFSFQKYLMWKELTNHYGDMLKSPIIRRIMTSEIPAEVPDFILEDKVEELYHPKDVFCPLSADSSQMAAILSAANGNSFVLQGPPGTGKSQTIANMIAHCIGMGKRVLFVSEKKVALEVVYRRLQEIGIGPFCLELHSKKSEKKEVVKSFYNALEFNAGHLNGEWDEVSEELKTSRDGLNDYFKDLHEVSPSGITAFKAFGIASRDQEVAKVDLEFESFLEYPASDLRGILNKLKTWKEFSNSLNDEEYLSWAAVRKGEWSSQTEDKVLQLINALQDHLGELKSISENSANKLPVNQEWEIKAWLSFGDLVEKLLKSPMISPAFLAVPDIKKYQHEITDHLGHLKQQAEQKEELDKVFLPEVYQEKFHQLKKQYEETKDGFFLITFIRKMKFKGVLKPLLKDKIKPLETYESYFNTGIAYQSGLEKADKGSSLIKETMGEEYQLNLHEGFKNSTTWTGEIHELITSLYAYDLEVYTSVRSFISNLLENRAIALADSSEIRRSLNRYQKVLHGLKANTASLEAELELNGDFFSCTAEALVNKLKSLKNTASLFRDITSMNVLKSEFSTTGLAPLFAVVDKGEVSKAKIVDVFNFNFHRQWLQEKSASSEILNNTTGLQLNNLDSHYKKTDHKYRVFTEKALSGKISADKPKMGNFILPDTPVGLIVRENKKSRKHLPIRKFLDSVSSVAKGLKPCYLMSPMSVSQYLPVAPDFDIVIFDEASQIPPWDAIGALARGKQAIIVGDIKQLPPTAFFSMKSEDDSDEKVDCESVLEMFGSIFPEMLLKWHYRSRSESLISFSNYHIYDNRLHTFPASHTDDNKVSLKIVTGEKAFYDRGKTKTNAGEARAVVDEIFSRLKTKDESGSIGVVTFSSVQATLISDLIDEQLQKEPKFENFFDVTNPEYIFVKNLENVQGDERDVILFSIGYGKDIHERISRNFGPLNNSGGERRLNVAITRARNEVKIFSNFHPRELDVTTSGSEGLRLLKEYLLYAQDGHSALLRQHAINDLDEFESIFEKEVSEELRKRGWTVKTQIGVGGYRMDLGVVHPDHPGQFLAGIECDGARYHSAKTARDRDILRQMVLEGLGWKIIRIWSTDWWYDSKKCVDKIQKDLGELLAAPEEVINEALPTSEEEIVEEGGNLEANLQSEEENEQETVLHFDPWLVNLTAQGEFFERAALVGLHIEEVVRVLAPISRDECFTIIARSWGFARRGSRIDRFLDTCSKKIHSTKVNGQIYYWNSSEEMDTITQLRLPKLGTQRHPASVAPEELLFGFLPILENNIEVPKEALFKEVAKMLGFSRVTQENMNSMNPALELLRNKSLISISNGSVLWLGNKIKTFDAINNEGNIN